MKFLIYYFGLVITIIYSLQSCEKDDFSWNLKKAPEIGYLSLKSNSTDQFVLESECLSTGYDKDVEMGFCWSINPNPTISDSVIKVINEKNGTFQCAVSWNLIPSYYFRSYVKNSIGIVYSQNCFVGWPGVNSIPTVQTLSIEQLSYFSFNVLCNVVSTGTPIVQKGVHLYDNSGVLIDTKISSSSNISFSVSFDGLNDGNSYSVRAFAITLSGIQAFGNQINVNVPKKYSVGEIGPSGGYIIYENPDLFGEWHFIEVAPTDIVGTYPWSTTLSTTNITSTQIGAGTENTNQIVGILGNAQNYAAGMANSWSSSGYTNWALPSFDELKLIKDILFDQGLGNLQTGLTYWSSSEDPTFHMNAWTVKMSSSSQNLMVTQTKSIPMKIRAIRKF
jgi:hypothetical protein